MKHVLTTKNLDELTGECTVCGPTTIKAEKRDGGMRYRCSTARRNSQGKNFRYYMNNAPTFYLNAKERDEIIKGFGSACQVCDAKDNLHLDHCHDSGKFRGVLCKNCNNALGLMRDDVHRLQRAIDYLS